jgi:hypothetical protein
VVPRFQHASVQLNDGRVLVVGGFGTLSAEVYNPSTGSFSLTPGNMRLARYPVTATLLANGKVLVVGGRDAHSQADQSSTEIFDPSTGTFTPGPNMTKKRFFHTATALGDGTVLVAGGIDPTVNPAGFASEIEMFDGQSFALASGQITGRARHVAVVFSNNKLLIAGGTDGNTMNTTFIIHNGASLAGPIMNAKRERFGAALLPSGKVLLAGGIDFSGPGVLTSTEVYDPASNALLPDANMLVRRSSHAVVGLQDGRVLVIGGESADDQQRLSSAEIYSETPPPKPPVANAGSDQMASEGAVVQLDGSASVSLSGKPLTYTWTQPGTEFPRLT